MKAHSVPELPLGLRGTYYEDTIPDTLDLVQRAELGLNYLTEIIDEELDYEMYFHAILDQYNPPVLKAHVTSLGACQAKGMEAMAFLRVMTGSQLNLEREAKMVDMMASLLGADGLHWVPGANPRKPWIQIPEPFVMVHGQGRMARAMMTWHQYTGDPAWKDRIDRLVGGLTRIVVHRDDYAYFPTGGYYDKEYLRSCYVRRGWKEISEPQNEKHGEEGSLFNHQGHIPGVLATWYRLTGNEEALSLSGKLVRFLTKPKFWADWEGKEYPGVVGAQHAHWCGHYHGHMNTLRAVLEYALATNDAQLKAFVRDGYEWARQMILARIGYFDYQGCATARIIGLAIKLSDAGIGDYWEDVDQYIRNHGVEMQVLPEELEYLRGLSEGKPAPPKELGISADDALRRAIGGFGLFLEKRWLGLCCGTHGNMGLFYAWDGTVRCADGTARVNLLLNRASPWLDIHSHLPYAGKVVIKNKTAQEAFVRIPLWVDRSAIRCTLDERAAPQIWFGNYLRFRGLDPNQRLQIEFPMVETTEVWDAHELKFPGSHIAERRRHTCRFRGNTLIEMSPPLSDSPLYASRLQRYSLDQAPMRSVTRYISPVEYDW